MNEMYLVAYKWFYSGRYEPCILCETFEEANEYILKKCEEKGEKYTKNGAHGYQIVRMKIYRGDKNENRNER